MTLADLSNWERSNLARPESLEDGWQRHVDGRTLLHFDPERLFTNHNHELRAGEE